MIEIEDVSKSFGALRAVSGLSLTAGKGEVVGFWGPNGAGKTTTMRMIAGCLFADRGRIRICGRDIETETRAAQRCIGYLPESAPIYEDMTVAGYLAFAAAVRGWRGTAARKRVDAALETAGLTAVRDWIVESLSKGYKRRVGLAQALIADPPVLILDEPTDGLDPNQKQSVRDLIGGLAAEKTIVVSTHIFREVEDVCTRAVIIDRGRIIADETPGELLTRSRHHNAVCLVMEPAILTAVEPRIKTLAAVAGTEIADGADGRARLTIYPKYGALLIDRIAAMAHAERWPVRELYAEPGRLDEVFRAITSGDAPIAGDPP